jgi:hypothetical protein
MNRRTTLALLLALATLFVPRSGQAAELETGLDDLRDIGSVHGIEREGDIPLP